MSKIAKKWARLVTKRIYFKSWHIIKQQFTSISNEIHTLKKQIIASINQYLAYQYSEETTHKKTQSSGSLLKRNSEGD
jgi:hypothetical protein